MSTKIIRLDGAHSSYIIDTSTAGIPLCRYWGKRLPDNVDLSTLAQLLQRPLPEATLDRNTELTLMPEFGFGWFGLAALTGCREHGCWATAFELQDVEHLEQQQSTQTTLHCLDPVAGLELRLQICIDSETDVLTRRSLLRNIGADDYRLDWCAAAAFELAAHCSEILNFEGQWSQEFQERRLRPGPGSWSRINRRGRTSHDSFPQLIIGSEGFCEQQGEVYGFHLGWSGNHRLDVEKLNDGKRQVQLGEWLAPGEMVLRPGETYESPTVYASYASAGLNDLADHFHRYLRKHVLDWPTGRMSERPVHLNTWEALYFDHNLEDLKALARSGAELGVERFVLDDGWFCGRNNDRAGLGDWTPDRQKYPQGLGPLVNYVRSLGMQFGLWVEPEMINPDSDLYRDHPDWALQLENRPALTGRNQLVLDLSNDAVGNYLFDAIDKLLTQNDIRYLKWDMNRDLATAGSSANPGAAVYHRQTAALYALLARIRQAHPAVEIESCASGGGRADFGILAFTQRIWTSDNNDPLARQSIQRGFLRFFPPELMGAHIGPSPSHIDHRPSALAFRAATALFGHLGLEFDVRTLNAEERTELKFWIDTYKQFRALLHSGYVHQLRPCPDAGPGGQGVVSREQNEALFAIAQIDTPRLRIQPPLRLPGLLPDAVYRIALAGTPPRNVAFDTSSHTALAAGTLEVPGAVLSEFGLQLPIMPPQTVLLLHLRRIAD